MRVVSHIGLSFALLALGACTSVSTLMIRPDPANALINIRDVSGRPVVTDSSGSIKVPLHFDASGKYTLTVNGGGSDASRFEAWTRDLTASDYSQLPIDPNDIILNLELF